MNTLNMRDRLMLAGSIMVSAGLLAVGAPAHQRIHLLHCASVLLLCGGGAIVCVALKMAAV